MCIVNYTVWWHERSFRTGDSSLMSTLAASTYDFRADAKTDRGVHQSHQPFDSCTYAIVRTPTARGCLGNNAQACKHNIFRRLGPGSPSQLGQAIGPEPMGRHRQAPLAGPKRPTFANICLDFLQGVWTPSPPFCKTESTNKSSFGADPPSPIFVFVRWVRHWFGGLSQAKLVRC